MKHYFDSDELLKQFKLHSTIAGILLLIAGIVGIFLPEITSLTLSYFVGWLLITGGIISGYHVLKIYNTKWIAWFKPVTIEVVGILILLYPLTGIAAVGLLLIIYFLFDGFAGIMFALEFRPYKGWSWMVINAVLSFIFALIFLISWPFSSVWIVGLFVGISLLVDGISMLLIGISVDK